VKPEDDPPQDGFGSPKTGWTVCFQQCFTQGGIFFALTAPLTHGA